MNNSNKYIKLDKPLAIGGSVKIDITCSESLRKYFNDYTFWAEYRKDIENVPGSLLVIPALSSILALSWATGADIFLDEIDQKFLNTIIKLRNIYKYYFPQFSCKSNYYYNTLLKNEFKNSESLQLFSGGIDSLATYALHRYDKPTLVSVWGLDIPLDKEEFWKKVETSHLNFASSEDVKIIFLKTNTANILNNKHLAKDFKTGGWWQYVNHGLATLGLCAPLSENIKSIYMPSAGRGIIGATNILNQSPLSWADTNVIIDACDLSRQEKIKLLKAYPNYLNYTRVCWIQHNEYNCGYCEKCLRTIVALLLEGIDPLDCNFNIKNNILYVVKDYLSYGLFPDSNSFIFLWKDIQEHIPSDMIESDALKKYHCLEFFDWFKCFPIQKYKCNSKLRLPLKLYLDLKYK